MNQHPDDLAVDRFAAAMKEKLAQAREKARSGWQQMDPADLSAMLYEHVEKGDPRDVANFCMFLWNLGQPITQCHKAPAVAAQNSRYHCPETETLCGKCKSQCEAAPAVAQEPVHFRAVLCGEQQDQAFGVVPKVVGFVDKKAAEQFILEKRDFQGWRYSLEPLYTEAPAVAVNEQMLEALNDFSDYVRTEQSSTDGHVQYSNTQINRLAFKARSAIAAAEAAKGGGG